MDERGIHLSLLVAQLFNFALLATWLLLVLITLVQVSRSKIGEWERIAWAALIVLVPLLGAIAFLLARPRNTQIQEYE